MACCLTLSLWAHDFEVDGIYYNIIKGKTNVLYARTITSSHSFNLPTNMHRLNPTVYIGEADKMFELAKEFISLKTDEPKLFYIWGHSYEFDAFEHINWEKFEEFCKKVMTNDLKNGI